jgi:hypothetical protein
MLAGPLQKQAPAIVVFGSQLVCVPFGGSPPVRRAHQHPETSCSVHGVSVIIATKSVRAALSGKPCNVCAKDRCSFRCSKGKSTARGLAQDSVHRH